MSNDKVSRKLSTLFAALKDHMTDEQLDKLVYAIVKELLSEVV